MKRLHVVGDRNPCNGMYVAAKLMAEHEEGSRVVTCAEFLTTDLTDLTDYREIVVHGCWLPMYWRCCRRAMEKRKKEEGERKKCGTPRLARMTHGNLDPLRLKHHGWKKWLAGPVERWLFRRCDRILATCEAEAEWIREYSGVGNRCRCTGEGKIEVVNLKRFFRLNTPVSPLPSNLAPDPRSLTAKPLHVLFLGRAGDPLKGVRYLEQAVRASDEIELRVVSDHAGEELERDWEWCDVLCLPTLSENFGLVVAEALERGKRVITTDGAPAWESMGSGKREVGSENLRNGLIYLKGYREGTDAERVMLLKDALL